jgi:hypothetical protein
MLKSVFMFRMLTTAFQGTVIFMAVELLRRRERHLHAEMTARRDGTQEPLTINMKREVHHDLESFLWVLVYAMMIHHYNSLTHETDRMEYKQILDTYFGHGCAEVIVDKRQTLYLAHSRVGEHRVPQWFPDPHERRFFIRCMTLIAENDREEEERKDFGTFDGEIDFTNPVWDHSDDERDINPDGDAENQFGAHTKSETTEVQNAVLRSRKRPPVITYESVVGVLKRSLDELK